MVPHTTLVPAAIQGVPAGQHQLVLIVQRVYPSLDVNLTSTRRIPSASRWSLACSGKTSGPGWATEVPARTCNLSRIAWHGYSAPRWHACGGRWTTEATSRANMIRGPMNSG